MLFRSFSYVCQPFGSIDDSEVVVFFEAPSERSATERLHGLLSQAWGKPPDAIESYNVCSDWEVLKRGYGDDSDGDARLFAIGAGPDGVSYADPSRTLMLVQPRTLRRLVAGQQLAQRLRGEVAA